MFRFIYSLFSELFHMITGVSAHCDRISPEHLSNGRARTWCAPSAGGRALLRILGEDQQFLKHLHDNGRSLTLIRMAVIGTELRVSTYRTATECPNATSVFNPNWQTDGVFHYLYNGSDVELMVRNNHPVVRYDPDYPAGCFTFLLNIDEIESMGASWAIAEANS